MSTSGQPPHSFPASPPAASQGTPGMPNMTLPHVTMSTGVTGAPATFANLNTIDPNPQQAPIKSEQPAGDLNAQSLLNELTEEGSTCNSLNLDSGLLNYITDAFQVDSLEQSDSLTKFLNQEMDNSTAGAGNMQQDVLMNTDVPVTDNLQDVHQQLTDLNR